VIDTTAGGTSGYALAATPSGGLKAGLHQSGRPTDPTTASVPDRELAARTAAWVERRFPKAGASRAPRRASTPPAPATSSCSNAAAASSSARRAAVTASSSRR
jgi:hypothetical protein